MSARTINFMQLAPVVAPGSQSSGNESYAPSKITSTTEAPTIYPPGNVEVAHTYTSYHQEPIQELAHNKNESWTLRLAVPIPSHIINPTLRSLAYIIKYSTTYDNGNSTVQADVAFTTTKCPEGILLESVGVYRSGSEYGPRMVDKDAALCLSVVPAVKCNGGNAQWSHYIDHRHLLPNVRIVQPSHLYLDFHVVEYPTTLTDRYLAVEVSASWTEDVEARKAKEEAERKAREEAERKAKEAAAAEAKRQEEAAKQQAEAAKRQAEAAKRAPAVAEQSVLEEALRRHPDRACPNGYGWKKTETGYKCDAGGHSLTWAELGMM